MGETHRLVSVGAGRNKSLLLEKSESEAYPGKWQVQLRGQWREEVEWLWQRQFGFRDWDFVGHVHAELANVPRSLCFEFFKANKGF